MEAAAEQVKEGEQLLAKAARSKKSIYPLTGAVIGTCIGGPVGLLAGFKIGSLAAIGGTVLGFTGGEVLKKWQEEKPTASLTSSQSEDFSPSAGAAQPTTSLIKSQTFCDT